MLVREVETKVKVIGLRRNPKYHYRAVYVHVAGGGGAGTYVGVKVLLCRHRLNILS
jgi:hypothetical protein